MSVSQPISPSNQRVDVARAILSCVEEEKLEVQIDKKTGYVVELIPVFEEYEDQSVWERKEENVDIVITPSCWLKYHAFVNKTKIKVFLHGTAVEFPCQVFLRRSGEPIRIGNGILVFQEETRSYFKFHKCDGRIKYNTCDVCNGSGTGTWCTNQLITNVFVEEVKDKE